MYYKDNYYEDDFSFNNLLSNKDFLLEVKKYFAEPGVCIFYEGLDFSEWAEALEKSSYKHQIGVGNLTSSDIRNLIDKLYTI